ncbi:MAG: hypothetical protein ACRDNG_06250 [Gaiellaceae bacterium]
MATEAPRYEHVPLAAASCRVQVLAGSSIPFVWHYHPELHFSDFLGGAFLARPELAEVSALLDRSPAGLHFPLEPDDPVLERIEQLESRKGLRRLLDLLAVLDDLARRPDAVALSRGATSGASS